MCIAMFVNRKLLTLFHDDMHSDQVITLACGPAGEAHADDHKLNSSMSRLTVQDLRPEAMPQRTVWLLQISNQGCCCSVSYHPGADSLAPSICERCFQRPES